MPKCSFKKCKNTASLTLKKDGISYFRFPRNPIRCAEWTSAVARDRYQEFFKPNSSSVVCSVHFSSSDIYTTKKGIIRLVKTAVPRLGSLVKDEGTSDKTDATSFIFNGDNENLKSPTTNIDPTEAPNNTEPDAANLTFSRNVFEENKNLKIPTIIMDTAEKDLLKKELKTCHKKLLDKNKVINNLRKKNNRLVKRNFALKTALKVLQKRFYMETRQSASQPIRNICSYSK